MVVALTCHREVVWLNPPVGVFSLIFLSNLSSLLRVPLTRCNKKEHLGLKVRKLFLAVLLEAILAL